MPFSADDFSAARAVASLKGTIDAVLTRNRVDGSAIPKYYTRPSVPPNQKRVAISPDVFVRTVLPYSLATCDRHAPFELIDPTCVISGTYDNYKPLDRSKALSRIFSLTAASLFEYDDVAQYAMIGTLPLYVALEGKNRVMLYREHLQPIGARINKVPYPSYDTIGVSDLKLHAVMPFGQTALSRPLDANRRIIDYDWVCGDRVYATLPFPDVIVPLLLRYGVDFGPSVFKIDAGGHQQKRIRSATGSIMMS